MKSDARGSLMRKGVFAVMALCVSAFAQWDSSGSGIYYNSGYVGIGTSTPGSLLDVYASSTPVIRAISGNVSGSLIILTNTVNEYEIQHYGGYLAFMENWTERLRIHDDKVGIGMGGSSLTERLEVSGNIKGDTMKCDAVKINGWTLDAPDYVFEKGYKLPTLKDVAKHISLKKHLPDIPSAAEIKKNGVDLAEMNMALLRKVEELTLYTIEQQQQIDELRSLIKKQ